MPRPNAKSALDIGGRLRAVRAVRRLSQRELARKSGVTNGMISQIEQNRSSPSIASLKRILDAIPMSLAEFFAEDVDVGPEPIFFTADQFTEINPARVFGRAFAPGPVPSFRQVGTGGDRAIQILHERYPPGADTGPGLYSHEAEEAGIVLEGRIEITVGNQTRALGPGEGYHFDSRLPHRFRNIGDTDCVIVSACTPPSF